MNLKIMKELKKYLIVAIVGTILLKIHLKLNEN